MIGIAQCGLAGFVAEQCAGLSKREATHDRPRGKGMAQAMDVGAVVNLRPLSDALPRLSQGRPATPGEAANNKEAGFRRLMPFKDANGLIVERDNPCTGLRVSQAYGLPAQVDTVPWEVPDFSQSQPGKQQQLKADYYVRGFGSLSFCRGKSRKKALDFIRVEEPVFSMFWILFNAQRGIIRPHAPIDGTAHHLGEERDCPVSCSWATNCDAATSVLRLSPRCGLAIPDRSLHRLNICPGDVGYFLSAD